MSSSSRRSSSPKNSTRKNRGNAMDDIEQGFARKTATSARRNYRRQSHKITLEFSAKKAQQMEELSRGLHELDKISHQLKNADDRRDLNAMAERYADSSNPNLEKMRKNIQFWKDKVSYESNPTRKGGRRRNKRKRTHKRNK